jgi:hypothetical protein
LQHVLSPPRCRAARQKPLRNPQNLLRASRSIGIGWGETLHRELGRLEGHLEITEVAESTLREQLLRSRELAERLEEELRDARRPWLQRIFGQ